MSERIYTFGSMFCGVGGNTLGFLAAKSRLFDVTTRFRCVGGIDIDPAACRDFEYLTKGRALCADVAKLTPDALRAFWGEDLDAVIGSPPCKGMSGLLSTAQSKTAKYRELNALVLAWVRLVLAAYPDRPPRLFLLENVPRIASRGRRLLQAVKAHLRRAGYVFHEGSHDCGELGGLAQHRKRFLLVARHKASTAHFMYQPVKRRVRGCGEVLEKLPVPLDGAGGPMHTMPRLSWLNWVRLALIPAGGDWRDLPGVLEDGQARRTVFRRHHMQPWTEPASTIGGSGSNGPTAVADPRIELGCSPRAGAYGVIDWAEPSKTAGGHSTIDHGGNTVADPRVRDAFDHGYGVVRWDEPSSTVAGGSHPGQGAYSVADVRIEGAYRGIYGVLGWQEAAGTITGNGRPSTGRFSVQDPRTGHVAFSVHDPKKAPSATPIIVAADGTWHRPLTTLELAALQDLPTEVDGKPLVLDGKSASAWRERIGNCIPPGAGQAIGEQMLLCLAASDAETFMLSAGGDIWVKPLPGEATQ